VRPETDKYEKTSVVSRKPAWIAAAFLPLALAGCGNETVSEAPARPVKVMVAPKPVTERALAYSGVIAPRIESTLGFRVSGKIMERFVNVGETVKAGQRIARLDEKDPKLAENSARAAVAAANTRFQVAGDALNRAKFLRPNGFIAQSALDQRQLEVDAAKSALDAARDQLDQAVNATGYALLLADKDGIVTSVRAEPGQVVGAGQAVITLAHSDDIEAAVAVPEQEIVKLKDGQRASVSLWSASAIGSEGKIREIAGAADPASRTYAVRVSIANPASEMRIGMTAAVTFHVLQERPAVIVPLAALAGEHGKTMVFVADPQIQTVARREVESGRVTDDGVSVEAGLKPGDILVTAGVQFLKDGMKVRLPKGALTEVAQADASASR
jgi:membrane fusion protein, multidrug efflux system